MVFFTDNFVEKDLKDRFVDVKQGLCKAFGSAGYACANERRHLLSKQCAIDGYQQKAIDADALFRRLRVLDKQQMIFCDIPLVGGVQMEHVYDMLTTIDDNEVVPDVDDYEMVPDVDDNEMVPDVDDNTLVEDDPLVTKYGLHSLLDYPEKERLHILQTYRKVIVVQHPLEKLWALYDRKYPVLFSPYPHQDHISTFQQFIDYRAINEDIIDPMLMTTENLCQPCYVNYTDIIKLESISIDAPYLLTCVALRLMRTSSLVHGSFAHIPLYDIDAIAVQRALTALPEDLLEYISKVYAADMRLFRYAVHRRKSVLTASDDDLRRCFMARARADIRM